MALLPLLSRLFASPPPSISRTGLLLHAYQPLPRRILNRLILFILRLLTHWKILTMKLTDSRYGLVPKQISTRPTRKIVIKSSVEPSRGISVHVYEPGEDCEAVRRLRAKQREEGKGKGIENYDYKPRPLPVHINLHGSGFTMPNHGEDAEPSAYLARTVPCTVLDATYALSPSRKLPIPIHDVHDVIRHVLARPDLYDVDRISIGGVSAGACAALLAATSSEIPCGTVKSIIAWCPITDFSYTREDRFVPELPRGAPGVPIPHWIVRLFVDSCLEEGAELKDGRVSPMYADMDDGKFPPTLFIVGTSDPLHPDSLHLHNRLAGAGVDSELIEVPNAGHAFDRCLSKKSHHDKQWAATWHAYERIVKRLRKTYGWELSDEDWVRCKGC